MVLNDILGLFFWEEFRQVIVMVSAKARLKEPVTKLKKRFVIANRKAEPLVEKSSPPLKSARSS